MLAKFTNFWFYLRSSLWFIPTLMVIGSAALSFLMIFADQELQSGWLQDYQSVYSGGPEGARAVLSTIAGSMIGVTGIAFSITIVTLTLASSQFGPRLLRNFMRDLGNQIVLGTFIATFTYCLLVLRMVTDTSDMHFIPHLSVTLGIAFALASLGVLIYFIHHTSVSIQADTVIAAVSHDLHDAIDRLFPERIGQGEQDVDGKLEHLGSEPGAEPDGQVLMAPESGYIQVIESNYLLELAMQHDVILRLEHRPGNFVVAACPLVTVWPAIKADDEFAESLDRAFVLGRQRTYTQDVGFALDQLVEIACRALSPGINDPFTAVACVEHIGAALCRLAERQMPSSYRYDDDGRLRIIAPAITFSHIVDQGITPIRQYCRTSIIVTLKLLDIIALVAPHVHREEDRQALSWQAGMIQQGSLEGLPVAQDRHRVEQSYQTALKALRMTTAMPANPTDEKAPMSK
jgi:uncharacterized membrane protein